MRAPASEAVVRSRRSAVLDFFAYGLDPQALQVEAHSVVSLDRHDFAERREQRILRRVPETKQVHVARRPVWLIEPSGEQHRTLQHEALAVWGETQPVQQALQRIAREQQLHRLAARMRQVQQALAYRGADVARAIRHRWSVP